MNDAPTTQTESNMSRFRIRKKGKRHVTYQVVEMGFAPKGNAPYCKRIVVRDCEHILVAQGALAYSESKEAQ